MARSRIQRYLRHLSRSVNGANEPSKAERVARQIPEASPIQAQMMAEALEISMTSPERMWALLTAVEYIEANGIPGDLVECGVWKGGSTYLMARALRESESIDRDIWLYDTFEGMPPPTEFDVRQGGKSAEQLLSEQADQKEDSLVWAISPQSEVEDNMRRSGYPFDSFHFVKGLVEDTLEQTAPQSIAIARLDTDWYSSTKHELDVLMPRMASGGVVIIDDYGDWDGSRRAVEEYIESAPWKPLLQRIDHTGRSWVVR